MTQAPDDDESGELQRRATHRSGPIVLSGALLGIAVYALVSGAAPLYEATAVVAAPAPALLDQYDRLTRGRDPEQRDAGGLDRADLGDVATIADRVRGARGPRRAGGEIDLRIDEVAGEAAIVVRARDPHAARGTANDIAAAIVRAREAAIAEQRASVRAALRLMTALAARDRRLRPRADALRADLAALGQLRRVPGAGLTVLRPARTPTQPIAPRVARDVVLATLAGMLACLTVMRLWTAAASARRRLPRIGRARLSLRRPRRALGR